MNDRDRQGFAYGSLSGHPEQGEESVVVVVVVDAAGAVRLEITAFSRPGNSLVRDSGAVARAIQARATRRYASVLTSGPLESGSGS